MDHQVLMVLTDLQDPRSSGQDGFVGSSGSSGEDGSSGIHQMSILTEVSISPPPDDFNKVLH
jgi:hypothetical protein